jgi:hypothetical protein
MTGPRPSAPDLEPKAPTAAEVKPVEVERVVISDTLAAPVAAEKPAPSPVPAEVKPVEAAPVEPVAETQPEEAPPAAEAVPVAPPETKPEQEREITTPSRRYMPPPEPEPTAVRPQRSRLGIAVVAVLLAAAGTYLGFTNGWFGGPTPTPHVPSGTPTTPINTGAIPVPPVTGETAKPPATGAQTAPPRTAATPAGETTAPATTTVAPATTTVAPATSAVPTASGTPTAPPATTATPAADGDGTNLAPTRGYLLVESPKEYGVFVGGVFLGLTGTKVELDCGIKFVRLGVAPEGGVQKSSQVVWTSEGKSANVVCKSVTKVPITPTR